MNLHGIVKGAIDSVNPSMPVTLRISVGSVRNADGTRTPAYATPGAITGSIAGTVLTVTASSQGVLQVGQIIAGVGVIAGTEIVSLGTGTGDVGTYTISRAQTVASIAMTTVLMVSGQVQPLSWRDIQQLEGLNIEGIRWKTYLFGSVNGLVRSERKGGDLMTISAGPHQGTWLVAQILEQWPDWVSAGITLQNGA